MRKKNLIIDTIKGIVIGASMLIPGVSGGTIAIILNVYDDLISSISSFFKETKESIITLLTVGGGAVVGIILFSKAILFVTNTFRMPMMFLFLGAALGSVPMLYRKAQIKKFSFSVLLYPTLGALLVLLIEMIPQNALKIDPNAGIISYIILVAAGIVLSVALVLPGISVSYMLLILGIYETTLTAIEQMQIAFLVALVFGVALGICLSTRLLEKAMKNYPQATYLLIIGFVLVSLREIFPGLPNGIEILTCFLTFGAGLVGILYLSRYSD